MTIECCLDAKTRHVGAPAASPTLRPPTFMIHFTPSYRQDRSFTTRCSYSAKGDLLCSHLPRSPLTAAANVDEGVI